MAVPLGKPSAGRAASRDGAAARARDEATGAYYDHLSRSTAWLAYLGYGGGSSTLTAHRALADPRAGNRPTFTRLHDVLAAALPAPIAGRVLDAGCGLGGTMLDLATRGSATFTGLTLSEQQAAIARTAVANAGLDARIAVQVGSYDSPPDGPFDLIVAIESLAHSPDPARTIGTLTARLAPGGRLAIVDDLPERQARGTRDLAVFQNGWRLPALLGAAELVVTLERCGLTIAADHDLTSHQSLRTIRRIVWLEGINRLLHRLAPAPAFRALLDSYHGGLALERLYRQSLMRYRLVVARKPAT